MLVAIARGFARQRPIVTARIELVPVELAHAREFFEAVCDSRAELQRFLPWTPFVTTRAQAHNYCEASASEWDQGRGYRLLMRERISGSVVGVLGFENLQHAHASSELGYWLRTNWVGRGYMREAASAAVAWAFGSVGMHRIRVAASVDNPASVRVIEALGFRFEGISREAEWCDGRWLSHRVYARLRHDHP
jgi:ribosomal-protein-serine acetyltransferase